MKIPRAFHLTEASLTLAACIYFVFIFFLFYPATYAIRDEAIYLSTADAFRHGFFYLEKAQVPLEQFIPENGRIAPFYPPALSLLLVPFISLHWKAAFLPGLLFHILNTALVFRLARSFQAPRALAAVLYLFHPALTLYSRTIMTDIPTTTLFLAALLVSQSPGGGWRAGLLLGISFFLRVSNAILPIPILAGLAFSSWRRKSWKDFLFAAIVLGGAATAVLFYNAAVYGNPLRSAYNPALSGVEYFGWGNLAGNIPFYLAALTVCYPGMLLVSVFSAKIRRAEFVFALILLPLFFSSYFFRDRFGSLFLDFLFGVRFLFPLLPILIMGYADQIHTLIPVKIRNVFRILLAAALVTTCLIVQIRHQNYLRQQEELTHAIYSVTPENSTLIYSGNAAELLQSFRGPRRYLSFASVLEKGPAVSQRFTGPGIYLISRSLLYNGSISSETSLVEDWIRNSGLRKKIVYEKTGLRIDHLMTV